MAREAKKSGGGIRWRLWLGGTLLLVAAVLTGLAARKLERYAVTDPQFRLSRYRKGALTVEGLRYASRYKVQRVFAADFERSIFSVPLGERRRRLLAVDWVEDASISRVWPDRLVVRIRERKPVAFVPIGSTVMLVDAFGALLEPPPQSQFAFPVLRGIGGLDSDSQRQDRVDTYLSVLEDMGYMAKDVSEMDVSDPDNIRIVAQVEHRAVELMLGDANFGRRYQNFLTHYAEISKQSPGVHRFDLRLDDRITAKD